MSFKDLEAEIKAWADLEAYAKAHKEASQELKRQGKRQKRAYKQAVRAGKVPGPLVPKKAAVKPELAPRVSKRVTMEVRHTAHRVHGDIMEVTYPVEAQTDTLAEVEAIRLAAKDGYTYVSLVCIVTDTK
jgi:hypothetical protein